MPGNEQRFICFPACILIADYAKRPHRLLGSGCYLMCVRAAYGGDKEATD